MAKIKHKERILKAAREKQQIIYKGTPIKLSADFSLETLQTRRKWHDIFKVMKGENLQPKILYPARLSFRSDGEIKNKPICNFFKKVKNGKSIRTTIKRKKEG